MKYYSYNINNFTDEEYESIFFSLPEKLKDKVWKMVKTVNRKLTVMGYILLKNGLKNDYDIDIEELIIKENKYGKPIITNINNLYYNISHSKDMVVCAISDKEIGIDVSYIKNVNIKLAKQFCNKEEVKYITSSKGYLRTLFKIFSLKESYIKMLGKSLMDIKNIEVITGGNSLTIKSEYNIRISFIENIDDYVISICEIF